MSHLFGRVIVGVHGTPGSLQALRFAVGHARAFGETLVPVIAWEPPGGDGAGRRYPPLLTREWADAAERRLLDAFDQGLGGPPENLPTRPQVVRGRAGQVLVTLADRESDVLVVGENRRGQLHRAWYGCAPQYCLRHAGCAVIVVPSSTLARDVGRLHHRARLWRPSTGGQVSPPGSRRAGDTVSDRVPRFRADGTDLLWRGFRVRAGVLAR
ncbi:universal stress protein [Actinocrinis puniceicyclus]|uniref:Universal stress protein n=1 Tax=Actinocrinis puniceicyclus TaxID=977794 RepID=A0A8J8BE99_9ACTN|nr:universal stress protein [Actinocrinis puniceicyclus]MBS2963564.1 universal stress protein [Actinocrinis puniceicyclus]